jgi:hypothetical protein
METNHGQGQLRQGTMAGGFASADHLRPCGWKQPSVKPAIAPLSKQHRGNKPVQTGKICYTIKSHTEFENKRALAVFHGKNNGFSLKMQCAVLCKFCTKRRMALSAKNHCFSYAKLATRTCFQNQCGI